MEVDDGTDVKTKKLIVTPIKPPGPSTVVVSEEDSGFENMDVDEPKECNFSESLRRKRPLELVSFFFPENNLFYLLYYKFICMYLYF